VIGGLNDSVVLEIEVPRGVEVAVPQAAGRHVEILVRIELDADAEEVKLVRHPSPTAFRQVRDLPVRRVDDQRRAAASHDLGPWARGRSR